MHCPHCQQHLDDAPDLAGQLVSCPFCGRQFAMPGNVLLPPAGPLNIGAPSSYQPPVNLLVQTEAPREKRLGAGGWFARSFGVAAGGVAGIVVCIVLVFIILEMRANIGAQSDSVIRRDAIIQSEKALKRHHIVALSTDAAVTKNGSTVIVDGQGRDRDHRTTSVRVVFTVAEFGNNTNWKLEEIEIGGRYVYP